MLWADDVRLGDLDGSSSHVVVPAVVGCGAPHTVNQLLRVLHHGVPGVVTGAGVAGVVRAGQGRPHPCLGPEGGAGEAGLVIPLTTP